MAEAEPNFSSHLEYVDSGVKFIPQAPEMCRLMDKFNSPGMDNSTAPTVLVPSYETIAREDYTGVIRDQGFHSPVLSNFIEINHLVPNKDSDVSDNLGSANGCLEMRSLVLADSKLVQVISRSGTRESNSRKETLRSYVTKRKGKVEGSNL